MKFMIAVFKKTLFRYTNTGTQVANKIPVIIPDSSVLQIKKVIALAAIDINAASKKTN